MAPEIPFKLMEINVFSAQDLPPVSKMLRTFAVAWINPDHKLSTRIDHHGHTNPTWNYKLLFRVEDRFLRSEAAAITIEIYNVAWLRDLPIGTAYLMINQISPPLVPNSPSMRSVALHIRRPSGHLQGILNIGINIKDDGCPEMPPSSELSLSRVENDCRKDNGGEDDEEGKQSSIDGKMMIYEEEYNRAEAGGSLLESTVFDERNSEVKVPTKTLPSTVSTAPSGMKPLPSEVVVNLKKGLYSSSEDEYGSSIFENWTEAPDDDFRTRLRSISADWSIDDLTPLKKGSPESQKESKKDRSKLRRHLDGGGLFSCFGRGFEFTLVCGSNSMRKNRKKMHRPKTRHFSYSEDDLRRFYT